jgi:hypothetical protein
MKQMKSKYICSLELKLVLHHWINANCSVAKLWEWKDCPWWCGEVSAVSLFAAAVWMAGGTAIAEYESPKVFKGDDYKGRCDLYFFFSNEHYLAEAKYCFPLISKQSESAIMTVESNLAEACENVQCVEIDGEKRLGINFAVPCLPPSEGDVDTCLLHFQKDLQRLGFAHLAWVFPPKARKLKAKDDYIHPGIAILIREA